MCVLGVLFLVACYLAEHHTHASACRHTHIHIHTHTHTHTHRFMYSVYTHAPESACLPTTQSSKVETRGQKQNNKLRYKTECGDHMIDNKVLRCELAFISFFSHCYIRIPASPALWQNPGHNNTTHQAPLLKCLPLCWLLNHTHSTWHIILSYKTKRWRNQKIWCSVLK